MPADPIRLDVGIHRGISAEVYHADPAVQPSLSRTLAWTLARRAPIHGFLEHPRLNPNFKPAASTGIMDFGELGHALLLGKGREIEVGKFKDFGTRDARQWRDELKAAGKIPALQSMHSRAIELCKYANAQLKDRRFLEEFTAAESEVTVIGKFEGAYLRARFDKLLIDPAGAAHRPHSETAIAFDIKITKEASQDQCAKLIGNMGYDLQNAFYDHTLAAADKIFAGRLEWWFLFIERSFPYVLTPINLSAAFRAIGEVRFRRALEIWNTGIKRRRWPTFCDGEGGFTVEPPKYLEIQELGEL